MVVEHHLVHGNILGYDGISVEHNGVYIDHVVLIIICGLVGKDIIRHIVQYIIAHMVYIMQI